MLICLVGPLALSHTHQGVRSLVYTGLTHKVSVALYCRVLEVVLPLLFVWLLAIEVSDATNLLAWLFGCLVDRLDRKQPINLQPKPCLLGA